MKQLPIDITQILIGNLIAGVFCGIAPLVAGFIKKRIKLGLIGFVSCIIGGFVLAILLALPVAIIFTLIIVLVKRDENLDTPQNSPDFNE